MDDLTERKSHGLSEGRWMLIQKLKAQMDGQIKWRQSDGREIRDLRQRVEAKTDDHKEGEAAFGR